MYKFIKKIGLFFLFASIFYIVALFLWGKIMPWYFKPNLNYRIGSYGHMHTRLKEVKNYTDVDILFLGASHTYRDFDPRIFKKQGYKSFNLGSSAQTPIQTLVLLKRHLAQLNPKLVIFEVHPAILTIDGVESAGDIISNEKNDIHSLKMALSLNHLKIYNTLTYAYINDLFSFNKNFKEPLFKENDTYISGGFVERKLSFYSPRILPKEKINLNKKQLTAFNECLKFIHNMDIPIILVYAPIPTSSYNRFLNNEEFDSIMSQYSKYYNFNKTLSLNDSLYFFDSDHLNQNGVEIFNRQFINTIPDLKELK